MLSTNSDPAAREGSFLKNVCVISVTFNSVAVVPAMLNSLPSSVSVVLVDNASSDAELLEQLAEKHEAKLIRNSENMGFGFACNQGAAAAETEYLLFLNPDAQLLPGAIDELVAAADRYPHVSAMNPRIEDADGREYFKRGSVLLPRSDWLPRGWPKFDCEVPILSGAALFVRREHFETIGGFDPKMFLYHEDDDISLRLLAECGSLMFIRSARVRHQGGRSSGRSAEVASLKAHAMGRSRIYAITKHQIAFGNAKALSSAIFQILSPIAWFSKRKRAKQKAFLRGLLCGLREVNSNGLR